MIIGITGRKRSGKNHFATVAAGHLASKARPYWFVAFADELKQQVLDIKVLKENDFGFDDIEKHKERFRPVLQYLGTEIVRELIDKDYWINKAMELATTKSNEGYVVFMPDVRFIDEAEAIQAAGGKIVKIEWTGEKEYSEADKHKSETTTDYIQYDAMISNDGTDTFDTLVVVTMNTLIKDLQ